MGVYLEDLTYKEILPILARTGKLIDTRKIMVKYRSHKGGLVESMESYKEFASVLDLLEYVCYFEFPYMHRKIDKISFSESFGADDRINWTSWRYVLYDGHVTGMCDFGEMDNDMGVEIKLERKPQKHRAIVIDSLLNSIEYEIKEEGKAEDILELIIDIRNTADRIIKLLKGE